MPGVEPAALLVAWSILIVFPFRTIYGYSWDIPQTMTTVVQCMAADGSMLRARSSSSPAKSCHIFA
jgi:hypothetical protein